MHIIVSATARRQPHTSFVHTIRKVNTLSNGTSTFIYHCNYLVSLSLKRTH